MELTAPVFPVHVKPTPPSLGQQEAGGPNGAALGAAGTGRAGKADAASVNHGFSLPGLKSPSRLGLLTERRNRCVRGRSWILLYFAFSSGTLRSISTRDRGVSAPSLRMVSTAFRAATRNSRSLFIQSTRGPPDTLGFLTAWLASISHVRSFLYSHA